MTRRRALGAALAIALGVFVAAVWFGGDDSPAASAPVESHEPDLTRGERSRAHARQRRQRALDRFLERAVDKTRALTVRVSGCGARPLPEAEVTLLGDEGAPLASGRSDAEGVFLARVPEGARVVAIASAGAQEGASTPSAGAELAVNICPGATVEGRVVDRHGRPVAGVTVSLEGEGEGELDVALTDEAGEFVLTDLQLTAAEVVATSEATGATSRLAPLAPFEVREITLTLEVGRLLAGSVVDYHGEPVPYAAVSARDFADQVVGRTRADRSGRFWLREQPFTPLVLSADDGAGGVGRLDVAADARREDLLIRLEPAGLLSLDYSGPYQGAFSVYIADALEGISHESALPPATALLSGSGASIWLPAPRTYFVLYGEPGEERFCGRVFLAPGARETVACGQAREASLRGALVDASGQPVVGALVVAMIPRLGRRLVRTDEGGAFELSMDLSSTANVALWAGDRARGYLPTRRRNISLAPGQVVDLGDLRLDRREDFPGLNSREPFGGIGAMVEDDRDGVRLSRIVKGGPLDRAGIQAGDVVIAIGDEASGFLPARDAVRLLRGEAGTSVKLRVRGADGALRDISVERAVIDIERNGWID